MFTNNPFQKVLIALFGMCMSLFFMINGDYVAPSKDTPIDASIKGKERAVMALVADPQVSNYMFERYPIFTAACEDLHNAQCDIDALIGAGDITENAFAMEYQLVYDALAGIDTRYIMASGNHDIRLRNYNNSLKAFAGLTNALNGDDAMDCYHYSRRIEGYKVIVLGSDRTEMEQAYISDEQLEWLDDEVAGENGKPTFVILHQPLKDTHNEKNAFGSITNAGGHVGEQSIAIKKILSKYKNVFLISGHLHSGFGPDSYNNLDGIHCINVPSMSIENKDGTYNNAGTGYIMEVYKTKVIFRARDFAQGTWVAETTGDRSYDITIKIAK